LGCSDEEVVLNNPLIQEHYMKDRFNLEQDLMNFSQIIEELDMLHERYIDGPKPMTEDEISNYIFALQHMCKLRYDRVWDTFCQAFELDDYSPAYPQWVQDRKDLDSLDVLDSSYPDGREYWKEAFLVDPSDEEDEEPVETEDKDILTNIKLALKCVEEERYATAEIMLRDTITRLKV
jgi:hypothetical protein